MSHDQIILLQASQGRWILLIKLVDSTFECIILDLVFI